MIRRRDGDEKKKVKGRENRSFVSFEDHDKEKVEAITPREFMHDPSQEEGRKECNPEFCKMLK